VPALAARAASQSRPAAPALASRREETAMRVEPQRSAAAGGAAGRPSKEPVDQAALRRQSSVDKVYMIRGA
jgi:hypothetical protein